MIILPIPFEKLILNIYFRMVGTQVIECHDNVDFALIGRFRQLSPFLRVDACTGYTAVDYRTFFQTKELGHFGKEGFRSQETVLVCTRLFFLMRGTTVYQFSSLENFKNNL